MLVRLIKTFLVPSTKKQKSYIYLYRLYSYVLENSLPLTLFSCQVCESIWLIPNNQCNTPTRRGHRLEPGNSGVRICSVKLVPFHHSSWLCFRCIILLLTYQRHFFSNIISRTFAFSKQTNKQTPQTLRWVLKAWMC